jgi:hypothetical protein
MKIYNKKPVNYWSYEKCKEIISLCESKNELVKKYPNCYNKIKEKKWYTLIEGLKKNPLLNISKRLIYVYIFPDNHCYVGLTSDSKRRDSEHKKEGPVYKHKLKTGLEPTYIILTDYVDIDKIADLENYYIEKYKMEGYILLNSMKGGSLGSNIVKWDKESIYKESLFYKTSKELNNNNCGAYKAMVKNGWLNEFYPNHIYKPIYNKYNYEDAKHEASLYINLTKFMEGNKGAYFSSLKNGWLNEFYPNKKPIQRWTYDKVKKLIQENNYKYQKELKDKNDSPFQYCLKNKLLKEFFPINYFNKIWSFEELKNLIVDNNYDRKQFNKKCSPGYRTAKENNWMDLLIPNKRKKR